MIELELLGTSSDGESLVLTDAQGERYSILISDELRGAIRRDRPKVISRPRVLLLLPATFRLSCAQARPRRRSHPHTAWT